MKDSNNAVPEYDSRRNGHYAKSEQFLHITIVLLKADSIGGHGDGGDEKGMERGRRPRPASPSGSLKINSDIYDIRIEGGSGRYEQHLPLLYIYFLGENFGFVGPVVKERSS